MYDEEYLEFIFLYCVDLSDWLVIIRFKESVIRVFFFIRYIKLIWLLKYRIRKNEFNVI